LFKRKNFFFFFKLKNQNKRKVFKYKKFKAAQTLLARFGYCFNNFIKLIMVILSFIRNIFLNLFLNLKIFLPT
jgi:hypothetical protein